MEEDDLKKALIKKALGFESDEIVEEYTLDENGNSILNKRKVTKKYNPPDISAVKFFFEKNNLLSDEQLLKMTDKELSKEKKRLLKLLKEEEKKNGES